LSYWRDSFLNEDKAKKIPLLKQETTLLLKLSKQLEGNEHISYRELEESNYIEPLGNEINLPFHIKQSLQNIFSIISILSLHEDFKLLFSRLINYVNNFVKSEVYNKKISTNISSTGSKEINNWISYFSNIIKARYCGASSLTESGEIRNIIYKGSYIKMLFIIDSITNRYLRKLSYYFPLQNKEFYIFSLLGSSISPEILHCRKFFKCAFLTIPFYFQFNFKRLSVIVHESVHALAHLTYLTESWVLENNDITNNEKNFILEYLKSKDKTIKIQNNCNQSEIGYKKFLEIDTKATIYIEALCDFATFLFVYNENFVKFFIELFDVCAEMNIFDANIFERFSAVTAWYYYFYKKERKDRKFKINVDKEFQKFISEAYTNSKLNGNEYIKTAEILNKYFNNAIINLKEYYAIYKFETFHNILQKMFNNRVSITNNDPIISQYIKIANDNDNYFEQFNKLWWTCLQESTQFK
jgi:hypothetical protein